MTHFKTYGDRDGKMAMGRALLDRHGLHDWQFGTENLNNGLWNLLCGGGPRVDHWGITDSTGIAGRGKIILVDNKVGRDFRQIVLHEIAHALLGNENARSSEEAHDLEWMKIAWNVGCTERLLYSYAVDLVRNGAPVSVKYFELADRLMESICAVKPAFR